jgi:hypothetical protein
MELANEIYSKVILKIGEYIDPVYLLTFILLSYFVKKYFSDTLAKLTKLKWRPVYTVLLIATISAIPFLLFYDTSWTKILFSYALGTSMHEVAFNWIEDKFKKNKP